MGRVVIITGRLVDRFADRVSRGDVRLRGGVGVAPRQQPAIRRPHARRSGTQSYRRSILANFFWLAINSQATSRVESIWTSVVSAVVWITRGPR